MSPKAIPLELFIWICALVLLALSEPGTHHYTLCPLATMGWSWCPGCGLGRSLIYLLHGDFRNSWNQHWLAIPALLILSYRTVQLSRQFLLSLRS